MTVRFKLENTIDGGTALKRGDDRLTLTKNQNDAMTALIKSCLKNMGGENLAELKCDPFTWVDASDLVYAGWSQKQAEGTFGSLVAANLVFEVDLNEYALTEDWELLSDFHE